MDIQDFLQFFRKPIHYLCIGVAVALLAPSEHKWGGYALIAAAIASGLEFLWQKFTKRKQAEAAAKERSEAEERLASLYDSLHPEERRIVNHCIIQNEMVYDVVYATESKYLDSLELKGFGKVRPRDFIFSGKTYGAVLARRGAMIREAAGVPPSLKS